jgi:hypothetical protein
MSGIFCHRNPMTLCRKALQQEGNPGIKVGKINLIL